MFRLKYEGFGLFDFSRSQDIGRYLKISTFRCQGQKHCISLGIFAVLLFDIGDLMRLGRFGRFGHSQNLHLPSVSMFGPSGSEPIIPVRRTGGVG